MTAMPSEDPDVRSYLGAVESALSDLGPDERDELLEDLAAHLAEVAADSGLPLRNSLGTPAAYAAELRSSAGLAPAADPADAAGGRG
jgi:uncharacterized membrane protein